MAKVVWREKKNYGKCQMAKHVSPHPLGNFGWFANVFKISKILASLQYNKVLYYIAVLFSKTYSRAWKNIYTKI